ncbi:HelD family protein [Catenuloplanes indicus]|uniref:DNA helicase IV n=1 Tax=Catenuloplanes indicus TaxID=137267 RepID=A0AAE3W0V0_9ACTN|nr:AAA family ATPase [Catenuloplanes indicus]MDQ0367431.1 DNA helicase IV [Catenuloplanes indicus]
MSADLEVELTAERQHLSASRSALRRMREHAEALFATGDKVAGDSYTAEQLGRHMARRVLELADDPSTPLFFGRLDFGAGEHAGHDYHVGRRHVTDEAGEPMVLDWRAPISRSFYRASVKDPQGVAVRRRFGFVEGAITSFEDEHLDRGEELGTASKILTQEIERPRVGPMRDIVATIQPEQDELVRADLADSLCVQGAPGTGKTAVGLHRAAYLLYLHRERLRRSGVLIVGPNRAFLGYIAAVLPALGEVEVAQSTVEDLIARLPVRGEDTVEAAVVKHDVRMAQVLHRAVWSHVGKPSAPMTVPDGSYRWRIGEEPLRRVVDEARREGLPYAVGRERVRARVVSLLLRQSEARRGDSPPESWQRRMAKARPVTEFLDEVWPALTPEGLLHRLLTDREALREHADGLLTDDEQEAIIQPKPAKTAKSTKWTGADTVLMDEIAGLLDRMPSFGHVVLDEAQDLSPMQCRAIARRSEHGSITLLGDLAQGTAPWASADWAVSLAHLGKPGAPVVPLTVGFRVPAVVVELANRLLPALRVNVPPAESLRRDGSLVVRATSDLEFDLDREVRAALEHEGSVAVIAADAAVDGLRAKLKLNDRVEIVPASIVKGLEYDHVIVIEPAEIVDAEPRGLNRLYVVLTRAVSRLTVIHAVPLPEPLT